MTAPNQYPEASQATTTLVLGILGLVLCGVLAPVSWVMANKELAAIGEGRRDPAGRGTAKAGRVLGIIGTVVLAIVGLAIVALIAVTLAGDAVSQTFLEIQSELDG